jgi:hypothetical protein
MEKPLAILTGNKREHISNCNWKENAFIATGIIEIETIMRKYYKQQQTNEILWLDKLMARSTQIPKMIQK